MQVLVIVKFIITKQNWEKYSMSVMEIESMMILKTQVGFWEVSHDVGGRLGPYIGKGEPDLRNLRLRSVVMGEDDILFVVSDGIHDNLDPIFMGKTPKEVGMEGDSWEAIRSSETAKKARDDYAMQVLQALITRRVKDYIIG